MPTTLQTLEIAGFRWRIADGLPAAALFDANGLRLAEWLASKQAIAIKERPLRTVWRVSLPEFDFYLKHDRPAKSSWLRSLVRAGSARAEFERGLEIERRGVPVPQPLAYGQRISTPGEGFLLTRTIPESVQLDTFLEWTLPTYEPARCTRIRQRIAVALGELLARLHDRGVTHRDLHPGNLLLQLGGDDEPRLYLIDLHAVVIGRPLSRAAGLANLVILNRWFMLRVSRSDRCRCWQAYMAARGHSAVTNCPASELALLGRNVERATLSSNLAFWRNRDRRCLGSNRYFRRVSNGELRGHVVADMPAGMLDSVLTNPDASFEQLGAKLLKNSVSSTVAELEINSAGETCAVIYKRFSVTERTDPWVALARPTAALRSWVSGHGLLTRYLPTPRPLAVFHRYRRGLPREGYLLTEKVSNAVDLSAYVDRLVRIPPGERRTRTRVLVARVARLLRTLHDRHLSHRDLKAPNLLLRLGADSITVEDVLFIDLVGVRRHRKLHRSRRLQNLARLHASFFRHPGITRTDKLRFLRAYLRWGLYGRLGWKRWWLQIETVSRAKVQRNLRSGRPLK
jgi:serine/threonine protein kinase